MKKTEFAEIKPLIRGLMAFIIYLRFGSLSSTSAVGVTSANKVVDYFVDAFEKELPE